MSFSTLVLRANAPYIAHTTCQLDFFKVPILMKATADDENPCPGYLFQEIGSILFFGITVLRGSSYINANNLCANL